MVALAARNRSERDVDTISALVLVVVLVVAMMHVAVTDAHSSSAEQERPPLHAVWEKTFDSLPDPKVVLNATGDRVGFSPGLSKAYVLGPEGEVLCQSPPSSTDNGYKVWVRHISSKGDRLVWEGLRKSGLEPEVYEGTGWLVDVATSKPLLRVPLATNGEVGEHVVSITADGRRLLIGDPAVDRSTRLVNDAGGIIWRSAALQPPLKSGARTGVLSSDGSRCFLPVDANSRWTCVTERGQRVWDLVVDGRQTVFSRNGRFAFAFGSCPHWPSKARRGHAEAGDHTWPIIPPFGIAKAPDPDMWRHVYAAPIWSTGGVSTLIGIPGPGLGKYSEHSAGVLWGHAESWMGSNMDSGRRSRFKPPDTAIQDARIGADDTHVTAAVLCRDGLYCYRWQCRSSQDTSIVAVQTMPLLHDTASLCHFVVCENGGYVLATMRRGADGLPRRIMLWKDTGDLVASLTLKSGIHCFATSGDGKRLAVLTHEGSLRLYSVPE